MIQSRAVTRRSQGSPYASRLVTDLSAERRRRLTHRALPALAGLAVVAAAAGMMVGAALVGGASARPATSPRPGSAATTRRCTDCSTTPRGAPTPRASSAAPTAPPRPPRPCGAWRPATRAESATATVAVPIVLRTRVFGRLRGRAAPARRRGAGDLGAAARVPGPAARRGAHPPQRAGRARATLLSRDGKVLARGPADARSSPLEAIAGSIAGTLAPEETARGARRALRARLPARLAGRAERARAGLREPAGRAAGRRAAGRARGCWPAPGRARRPPCAPRSTPACRRRP